MRTWLELNFIIIFTYIIFSVFRSLFNTNGKFSFENDTFKAFGLMALFPLLLNIIPVDISLPPVINKQVSMALHPSYQKIKAIRFSIPQDKIAQASSSFNWSDALFYLISLGLLIWAFRLIKDALVIRKMIKGSTLIKRYGKLNLYLCPDLKVPCSFWIPTRYFALFPENVLVDKKLFTHALSHELQHHRQGDTKMIFIMEVFRAIFYINPVHRFPAFST